MLCVPEPKFESQYSLSDGLFQELFPLKQKKETMMVVCALDFIYLFILGGTALRRENVGFRARQTWFKTLKSHLCHFLTESILLICFLSVQISHL